MADLGDTIGGILAAITEARVQADLKSLQVARMYAEHDLLRHMPVPRFRLPTVTVDIPVVVNRLVPPDEEVPARELRDRFDLLLKAEMAALGYKPDAERRAALERRLDATWERLQVPDEGVQDADPVAAALVKTALRTLRDPDLRGRPAPDETLRKLQNGLPARARAELARVEGLHRADVDATASSLAAASRDKLMMVRLTVSEQGQTWVEIEGRGSRLVPE